MNDGTVNLRMRNSTRTFAVDSLATLFATAGLGLLLLLLTAEVYFVECAQKASSCSDSFFSVFDFLVICISVVGIAVAGSGVAVGGQGRPVAMRNISICAVAGLALTVLYGMIPTMTFGFGIETVYYGFPFTVFVQSAVNAFSPSLVVLNYAFWLALGSLIRPFVRLLRKSKPK